MTHDLACRPRAGSQAGFTLIELLVATTLVAFLSLLLFGGLRFGTRVWETTEIATTDNNHVRAAQLFLSQEVAGIYPFYAGDQPTDKHVDFAGEEKRLTFFAPSRTLPGGMDLVTIQALPEKGSVSLVVASKPELTGPQAPASHHILIRGLKWFQISYFGAPAPAGMISTRPPTAKVGLGANAAAAATPPPQWTSVWEGQRKLPQLIRFRAAFQNRSQWPDLVLSPRTDIDESCVLDQMTKYCQGR